MLSDNATLKYIDGVATHWYWDSSMTKEIHKLAKTDKKDTFLLASESCKYGNFEEIKLLLFLIKKYIRLRSFQKMA